MELGWRVIVVGCRSFDEAYKAGSGPASAPAKMCVFRHFVVLRRRRRRKYQLALCVTRVLLLWETPLKHVGPPEHRRAKVPAGDMR